MNTNHRSEDCRRKKISISVIESVDDEAIEFEEEIFSEEQFSEGWLKQNMNCPNNLLQISKQVRKPSDSLQDQDFIPNNSQLSANIVTDHSFFIVVESAQHYSK